ncbi:MAG: DUF3782 domain-containing protein [Nitrospinae bacterium]|nr:DUF3782 domain-containing protein [Nitrospinota bacterium]
MLANREIKTRLEKAFPIKQAVALADVFIEFKGDLVKSGDFNELKNVVKELAEAQKRTEVKMGELAGAQKRTEVKMEELAEAQKRTDYELVLFRRTFTSQIGGLGARWGMMTESSFRNAMEGILSEVGFKAERFIAKDKKGTVFGYPAEVELDVVVKNGKTLVIEIKSSVSRADAASFDKKVSFYEKETRRKASRKIIISPYTEPAAHDAAKRLGIEVFTDINDPAL